ncbi:hypothetical protein DVR12_11105 [Chitinophaga silvatica]|uniref:Carbohydrate-binding domain-containing protein n=1 Tax=Chitinophaga silvatica TaxID=2282649 RepID=A0A3E1YAV6_9BACT|nr:carbohydrate-binding family 9-like protein [Chitinophaga silvatica]RFS23025.1 hypothetical protein DVR12_11105 [Chitinophaga silvatica]
MKPFLYTIVILFCDTGLFAQQHYICIPASSPVKIDGILNDEAWQKAQWTNDFVDITGSPSLTPKFKTRAKMIWDDQYLYIAAELEEPAVSAHYKNRDDLLFKENDFEVFIDPDGDANDYYELEINALNTVMDLYLSKPYRSGGKALINWDAKGMKTAVHVSGTLNKPGDKDQGWTVEMAIPYSALSFMDNSVKPSNGSIWRMNFLRVEWDQEIKDGQYTILKKPEHNWSWSPQGIVNMHLPERWGYVKFTTEASDTSFQLPASIKEEQVLWQVFIKEMMYRWQHQRFAQLAELELPDQPYKITLEATTIQFEATINNLSVNQDGRLIRK